MALDLASLGWDPWNAVNYARFDRSDLQPGRTVRVDRGVCTVLTAGGAVRASAAGNLLVAAAADAGALPCVGDWLVLRNWPDGRITIEVVLPRRNVIVGARIDPEQPGPVLAANVDALAVVEPIMVVDIRRVERFLELARESGAPAMVLLSKADLAVGSVETIRVRVEAETGAPVYPVSVRTGEGLASLRPFVAAGRTLGLLGPQRAGRSSIVSCFA